MKKIIFIFIIIFSAQFAKALPIVYCGQYGNMFSIYWYIGSNNQLSYIVTYIGPCYGGPWGALPYVSSAQEAGAMTEAGNSIYSTFSSYNVSPVPNDNYTDDLNDSANQISSSNPSYWIDPNGIDQHWAKLLATSQGKIIYASKLRNHPWNQKMDFEIWDVNNESNDLVQLLDIETSDVVFETTVDLNEGKNIIDNIDISHVEPGNYILLIRSSLNTITRSITITH
jgi:hypothetical protein